VIRFCSAATLQNSDARRGSADSIEMRSSATDSTISGVWQSGLSFLSAFRGCASGGPYQKLPNDKSFRRRQKFRQNFKVLNSAVEIASELAKMQGVRFNRPRNLSPLTLRFPATL